MNTAPKSSPFVGCWQTQWTVCNGGLAGANLAIKNDIVNPTQFTGAWGGRPDDTGFQHCGFLTGKLDKTGTLLTGTWYEIIYKDTVTCPSLSYSGTFSFTMTRGNQAFTGFWTDKDGPNKDCKSTMQWNGKRA